MSPLSARSGQNDMSGIFTRRKVSHAVGSDSISKSNNGTQVGFLLSNRYSNSPKNSTDRLTVLESTDHSTERDQRSMTLKERLVR